MATVLTLTANTLLDWLAQGAVIPARVNRVAHFEAVAGGKGLNVGRVLARHGHRVLAAGFAGGETGRRLAELVEGDGMEPLFAPTAARTRVGFQVADGERTTAVLENGFAVSAAEVDALVALIGARLARVDLVIIGGSVPDASCDALYARVLEGCAAAGVPCWLDAYGPAAQRALAGAHAPAVGTPNREELGSGELWARCGELHVTDGPRAVEVRGAFGRLRVEPPAVVERNPIGSGDCYLAGLAHARLSGAGLEDCLRYAAAAGAANAARDDCARIGPEEIAALVGAVRIVGAEAAEPRV